MRSFLFLAFGGALLTGPSATAAESSRRESWKVKSNLELLVGGATLGDVPGNFGYESNAYIGMVEQVSLTCRIPAEALVQNLMLIVRENEESFYFALDFKERPPAADGHKIVVVSQAVRIRLRFGMGGLRFGYDISGGPSEMLVRCHATLSGYKKLVTPGDK